MNAHALQKSWDKAHPPLTSTKLSCVKPSILKGESNERESKSQMVGYVRHRGFVRSHAGRNFDQRREVFIMFFTML